MTKSEDYDRVEIRYGALRGAFRDIAQKEGESDDDYKARVADEMNKAMQRKLSGDYLKFTTALVDKFHDDKRKEWIKDEDAVVMKWKEHGIKTELDKAEVESYIALTSEVSGEEKAARDLTRARNVRMEDVDNLISMDKASRESFVRSNPLTVGKEAIGMAEAKEVALAKGIDPTAGFLRAHRSGESVEADYPKARYAAPGEFVKPLAIWTGD